MPTPNSLITAVDRDYLWLQIRDLPYFRGLLRAVEARFYEQIDLPTPVLDLGCGDGDFAQTNFDRAPDVGLDPWTGPLGKAAKLDFYPKLIQGDGAQMPFEDGHFASVLSNSVLEHIPHLDEVLAETARVTRVGGTFAFCVPNHQFNPNLSIAQFFDRLGLTGLAGKYRRLYDWFARHIHLESPEQWTARLEKAGFQVERYWHYFSPQALHALEWGHYFGLPSLLIHAVTRRWIIAPTHANLRITERYTRKFYDEPIATEDGVCTFYIARRV